MGTFGLPGEPFLGVFSTWLLLSYFFSSEQLYCSRRKCLNVCTFLVSTKRIPVLPVETEHLCGLG